MTKCFGVYDVNFWGCCCCKKEGFDEDYNAIKLYSCKVFQPIKVQCIVFYNDVCVGFGVRLDYFTPF